MSPVKRYKNGKVTFTAKDIPGVQRGDNPANPCKGDSHIFCFDFDRTCTCSCHGEHQGSL